jgi:hypothetical protein
LAVARRDDYDRPRDLATRVGLAKRTPEFKRHFRLARQIEPALRNGPMDRAAAFREEHVHASVRGNAEPCLFAPRRKRLSPRTASPLPFPPDHTGRALPLARGPLPHPFDPRPCHNGIARSSFCGFFPPGAQDVPESDGLRWRRNL